MYFKYMNKNDLLKLPHSPGCYLYKDKNNTIIYVGKAKDLKKRVSSYFNRKDLDIKTKVLVSKIVEVDFIVTNTEVEAFLLENNLIKKHQPKYNIDLKDSKRYASIEKTNEEYPKFKIARKNYDKGKIFGPFTSAKERDYILETLNKTFKLRTCNHLPKKECLRYHIGFCSAPCINKITKDEYQFRINSAENILQGKTSEIIKIIETKMQDCSKQKNYEKAIECREIINSLKLLKEKQEVERQKKFDEDIINYKIKDNKVYLLLFKIYKGILDEKQEFVFDYSETFFEEFLSAFYSENTIPKKIIVPEIVNENLQDYFSNIAKHKVEIVIPQKGELKELLELVAKNIDISFFNDIQRVEILQKTLGLNQIPTTIECFDISHLSGTKIVASMVQFKNGKPNKSNYRKFKLKTVISNDDFASMREVVYRRYSRLKRENQPMPDLIVIDGGLGQLNCALESLNKLDIKIPIISLAKKLEEIYVPGREETIKLDNKNKGRLLLQAIRDEAHRFAITFNRSLRKIDS